MLLRLLLAATLALLVLLVTAIGAGAFLWSRATGQVEAAILQGAAEPALRTEPRTPEPVRRYLDLAIPDGAAPIRVAHLEQSGEFLLTPPDGWAPFTAMQLFTVHPPAMLWDASIRAAPLLAVRVRDSYTDGVGSMRGAMLGLLTVLEDSGPDAMADASLARYLAESPWFPTRLRPSEGLEWTAIDDSTAEATLRDGDVTVSLEFRFAPTGEVREIYADRRFRGETEDPRYAPWIGRFSAYELMDGYRIPTRAEVAWVLDGEERAYWRGRIEWARYETAADLTTAR